MFLTINGLTAAGFRLDDLNQERVGLDMLMHPFALVPELENAYALVRRANAHDDLLIACRAALADFEMYADHADAHVEDMGPSVALLKAAIAKAEEVMR